MSSPTAPASEVGTGAARPTGATLREALRIPWVTQQALFDLSAPWQHWRTRQDMVAWAETRLRVRVGCVGGAHRIQVDPHTGRFTDCFRTRAEREKAEAAHMLWTLGHPVPAPPPPCRTFEPTLATWVGNAQPPNLSRWKPQWHGTMQALRTVVRTVQYLDAGIDLHAERRWLELGVTPATLTTIRVHIDACDMDRAEEQVLDDLVTLTNRTGRLSRQRKDATQELTVTLTRSMLQQMAKRARLDLRAGHAVRQGPRASQQPS